MKNKKVNKYILWGLLINSFPIVMKQFVEIPDAVACFGTLPQQLMKKWEFV